MAKAQGRTGSENTSVIQRIAKKVSAFNVSQLNAARIRADPQTAKNTHALAFADAIDALGKTAREFAATVKADFAWSTASRGASQGIAIGTTVGIKEDWTWSYPTIAIGTKLRVSAIKAIGPETGVRRYFASLSTEAEFAKWDKNGRKGSCPALAVAPTNQLEAS